eukprot:Opistho-2@95567
MSVGADGAGPKRTVRPDCDVIVEEERQVVGNEILPGDAQIKRVPVVKLGAHLVEGLLGNCNGGVVCSLAEHVVPCGIRHVLRANAKGATRAAVERASLEEMRDRVVRHVDCRVRQRLDEILFVPRNTRSKTIRARARPLVQPVERLAEVVHRIVVKRLELVESKSDLLLPVLIAVVQIPLVAVGNNALVARARHDLLLRLKVADSKTLIDHFLPDDRLCVLNPLALVLADKHDALSEALEIDHVLGLVEQIAVVLAPDLEVVACLDGAQIAKPRDLNDGDGLKRQDHFVADAILLAERWLLDEVAEGGVVIRGIRRH